MKIVYVRSYFSSFLTLYDYLEAAFGRAGHEVNPFDFRKGFKDGTRQRSQFFLLFPCLILCYNVL